MNALPARVVVGFLSMLYVFLSTAVGQEHAVSVQYLDQLDGGVVGVLTGTDMDGVVGRRLTYAQFEYYDDYQSMEDALKAGEVDALLGGVAMLRRIAAGDPDLRILEDSISHCAYGFGFRYRDKELYGRFNSELLRLKHNGGLDLLVEKWLGDSSGEAVFTVDTIDTGDDILRLGTCPSFPPFTYAGSDGQALGLDIDIARNIATAMGKRLEVVSMDYDDLLPALFEREIDCIGSCLGITANRAELIHFTDSYFRTGVGALVRAEASVQTATDNRD